jgi:N-acyl-D-aspartate/D-glutamate deacylase
MADTLVIRGGIVVDGTGSPGAPLDVLVDRDRVAALLPPGAAVPAGTEEYHAQGRHVLPGFIDVHAHDDLAVLHDPWLTPKLSQGVTTVIVGNCGLAVAPVGESDPGSQGMGAAVFGPTGGTVTWTAFADYLSAVQEAHPAVNVGSLAAHGAIRVAATGFAPRAATSDEIDRIVGYARAARAAGAFGLSTGLGYQPASTADTDEIVAVASVFGPNDGLYVSHVRDESDGLDDALTEALSIGERSGCHVHISHLKCAGQRNWGRMGSVVTRLAAAGATADVYPYTAASTALRPALHAVGAAPLVGENYIIASAPGLTTAEGRSLADLAAGWGCSAGQAADRVLAQTADRATVVYFTMDEADVVTALGADITVVGSDGIALAGKPHPRLYGTFPRVLARYADTVGGLSFATAVHRMTGRPAEIFQVADRGRIAPGCYADLVIVNRAELADRATYRQPAIPATGIDAVLVNGAWAVAGDGRDIRRAGRVLRHHRNEGHSDV